MELLYTLFVVGCICLISLYSHSLLISSLAFCIICAYLPTQLYLIGGKGASNIISYIFLFVMILQGRNVNNRFQKDSLFRAYTIFCLTIVIVLVLLSFLGTDLPIVKQLSSAKFSLLSLIIPLFCLYYMNEYKYVKTIYYVFVVIILSSIIYSFFCYAWGANPFGEYIDPFIRGENRGGISNQFIEEVRGGLNGRVLGFTDHPLVFSGVLLCSFFVVLQASFGKIRNNKILNRLILGLIIICLFLTGSRSGIIAFFVGFVYYVCVIHRRNYIIYISLSLLVVIMIGQVLITDEYIRSIIFFWEKHENISGSDFSMRIIQLEETFSIISRDTQSFLFGLGNGWCNNYAATQGVHPLLLGFESILFSGFIEFGIVGFCCYYVFIWFTFFRLNKNFSQDLKNKAVLDSFSLTFICYCIFTGVYALKLFFIAYVYMLKRQQIETRFL